MKHPPTKRRRLRRALDCLGALVAVIAMIALSTGASGVAPPLGTALTASTGVWNLSPESGTAVNSSFQVAGLQQPGTISFEADGATHITAGSDQDLWLMTGFLDARFRLVQMDLERREAESQLSAILGNTELTSDEFELSLGVMRAAERNWQAMAPTDPAREALVSYTAGVNAGMSQLEADNQLPAPFKLLGYTPSTWTPLDSLAIQGLMTQTLSFSDAPLTFSYASGALPASVFNSWFPVVSANPQTPYDPGPYQNLPLSPVPVLADPGASSSSGGFDASAAAITAPALGSAPEGEAFSQLETVLASLPINAMHYVGNSNAWAISGSKTASGQAILAGDPHLQLTLPSDWYQLEGTSPDYHFTGVQLPGIPVPLLGKTDHIAWSLTNSQHPVTLYYEETTSPAHPGEYYYKGAWQKEATQNYTIPVAGQSAVSFQVAFAAQGPIMQEQGITAAVWWAGALPSTNIDSILQILRATDYTGFTSALQGWAAPALNFVYTDDHGNIGAIDAGVAPQVPGHDIALPMPGDGSADVTGTIPFAALPQSYNPSDGYIVTANNREVAADYPYEFSTSYNFADPGYRSEEITQRLSAPGLQTAQMNVALQDDVTDTLAQGLVPEIVKSMAGQSMTAQEQQFLQMLSGWNYQMAASSPEAFFFQKFIVNLVWIVFEPWWEHYKIPGDPLQELAPDANSGSFSSQLMYGDLLAWATGDPDNPTLSLPNGTHRDATQVLAQAFHTTISKMDKSYGTNFAKWDFGLHNFRTFPSLMSIDGFNYGPIDSGSDSRTVNAGVPVTSPEATGGSVLVNGNSNTAPLNVITTGASFRMVVDWGTDSATAVLPGGDSEDPISPWYANGIPLWLNGQELPLLEGQAAQKASTTEWRFTS